MRSIAALGAAVAVAACTSSPKAPPVPSGRFAVDSFTMPSQHVGQDFGGDLNGDGHRDNQIGQALAALDFSNDLTTHGGDMIAGGAIASSLVLDLGAVSYFGFDGADAIAMPAKNDAGVITTGRAKPGMAMVVLPIFSDADPTSAQLDSVDVQLVPDGVGGYDVAVHGAFDPDAVWVLVQMGLQQMLFADPDAHYPLADLVDPKRKGSFTPQDLQQNSFLFSLLQPDVNLMGMPMVSFGYAMHVIPCDAGACVTAPPADLCHDRVQDNGETGVDCGGSCAACKPAVPSCTDGVRDGLETDVDCGWNCTGCDSGKRCYKDSDCFGSFVCSGGTCR
jgi:hypothetical protein